MGQGGSSKGTRKKGAPSESGTGGGIVIDYEPVDEETPPEQLTFRLNNVVVSVLRTVQVGDSVSVHPAGAGLQVLVSTGRLGDVPPRYVPKIKERKMTSGAVSKRQGSFVWVTVR